MIQQLRIDSLDGSDGCFQRLSDLGQVLPHVAQAMPDAAAARLLLPPWLVQAFAPDLSHGDADESLARWRVMSTAERQKAESETWSLENWLYWMDPVNATWTWRGLTRGSTPNQAVVEVEVDGWPTALGALTFAIRASGAAVEDSA